MGLPRAAAAERIGIRQGHDRRVKDGRQRQRQRDDGGALRHPNETIAQHRHRRRDHDRHAQRVVPVGAARCQRDREDPHDHGDRQRDADRTGIEALGREPERQERQLHPKRDEERGVEDCEPPRKGGMQGQRTSARNHKSMLRIFAWLRGVSRARRSTSRAFTPVFAGYGGALQTRDRHSLWRSRISGAPFHFVRAAAHLGHLA